MQFMTTCGAESRKVFVSGTWEDGIYIVESVIPGGCAEPVFNLLGYLSEEQIEALSLAASGALSSHYQQMQEDKAAELADERSCV